MLARVKCDGMSSVRRGLDRQGSAGAFPKRMSTANINKRQSHD